MTQNGLSAASTAMMACANFLWKKTTASSPAAARHAPNSSTPRIPSNSMAGDFKSGNWLDSTERSAFNGMHTPPTTAISAKRNCLPGITRRASLLSPVSTAATNTTLAPTAKYSTGLGGAVLDRKSVVYGKRVDLGG